MAAHPSRRGVRNELSVPGSPGPVGGMESMDMDGEPVTGHGSMVPANR